MLASASCARREFEKIGYRNRNSQEACCEYNDLISGLVVAYLPVMIMDQPTVDGRGGVANPEIFTRSIGLGANTLEHGERQPCHV